MTQTRFNPALLAARLLVPAISIVFFTTFLTLASPARADDLQDVSKLVKQGQFAQALELVDKHLISKPKDAQGRFLKGIVLTEMNKPNEAITIFTKLTEDYPELPEPYNNLAVIYAQQKNYDKARQSLEMAIRTHPSYATAHENLGDIYARMASQAYDKALQIDSSNSSAQSKLALIRDLMGSGARPGKAGKPAESRPAEPVRVAEAPKAAPAAVAPAAAPVAAAKAAETPKAPAGANAASGDITKAVDRWLSAWSRKETKAYLAMYASDFKTPAGEARSAWEAERKKRINKPGTINVSYERLQITAEGDSATVKFRQHYKSGALKTSSNKLLQMVKRDGVWQIQQERVGS